MVTPDKSTRLAGILSEMGSVVIAYSGGVDSTFLAAVAHDILGPNALVVTAKSPIYPPEELDQARATARELGFRYLEIDTKGLENPLFVANTAYRCYYCKRELFQELREIARIEKMAWVADGSNYDDRSDYRPGRRAATEFGIRSPLCEVDLTKEEIRVLARRRGLPFWDKPNMACLATRLPYETVITRDVLGKIAEGETYLRSLGIRQLRLRHYGDMARIEVDEKSVPLLLDERNRRETVRRLKSLGYTFVTLDLAGYRSGSMDDSIKNNPGGET